MSLALIVGVSDFDVEKASPRAGATDTGTLNRG